MAALSRMKPATVDRRLMRQYWDNVRSFLKRLGATKERTAVSLDSNFWSYIEQDLRARLQAVPKVKQIGYYSDAYKLEFVLPKFNMYRRILAQILADDFIRPRLATEAQAMELARLLLRDNARRIFNV